MNIVEYDAARRGDVADLMARVWGDRPREEELAWFYERNPVRPASVLLGEDDGRVIATVAMAFLRMSIRGEEVEVGMPLRVATDPAYRGRGIFNELQAANEQRARDLGIRLLLTVPNAASAPVFVDKLDWTPLPSLRVWARPRVLGGAVPQVERFTAVLDRAGKADRVLRDTVWLNWRFVDSPQKYLLINGAGVHQPSIDEPRYAVVGRRGRTAVLAAARGDLLREAAAVAHAPVLIAAPPPWERRAYALGGYVPTHKTFTVLGKSLAHDQKIPERPHFELGDLDFL